MVFKLFFKFLLNYISIKILEIKSSIQCPIALLNSPCLANVLVGQKMLYYQAPSLLAYSRDARKSIANNHHRRCWLIDINKDDQNNLIR